MMHNDIRLKVVLVTEIIAIIYIYFAQSIVWERILLDLASPLDSVRFSAILDWLSI